MDCKQRLDLFHLPGFRFHPTEEELVGFYLRDMVLGRQLICDIHCLNIYLHDPHDLPGLCPVGEREWYFFVPRHLQKGRPNRTTANGFWKATGSDRKILSSKSPAKVLGLRKTLVFYHGRAPGGSRTDWIMNEYRLPDSCNPLKVDVVLCKIYRKATSMKALQQRATYVDSTHVVNKFAESACEKLAWCHVSQEDMIQEMIAGYIKNEDPSGAFTLC